MINQISSLLVARWAFPCHSAFCRWVEAVVAIMLVMAAVWRAWRKANDSGEPENDLRVTP